MTIVICIYNIMCMFCQCMYRQYVLHVSFTVYLSNQKCVYCIYSCTHLSVPVRDVHLLLCLLFIKEQPPRGTDHPTGAGVLATTMTAALHEEEEALGKVSTVFPT